MQQVLMTMLYILLFVVCLSLLIMIHELGHFTAAKIFKVYVQEYSIGFGPALIHKKRKNGETYFSLRIIPFGGYVAMYGEDTELEDGVVVEQSRSLEGIKRWKRAIIMVAGVFMNSILALTIFFVKNVTFSDQMAYLGNASVTEGSKAAIAGIKEGDYIAFDSDIDESETYYNDNLHLLDMNSLVTFENGVTKNAFAYMDLSKFTNYKNLKLNRFLVFYETNVDENGKITISNQIVVGANFKNVDLNIKTWLFDENKKPTTTQDHHIIIEKGEDGKSLEDFGYSIFLLTTPPLPFFKAIGQSFIDFGNTSLIIGKTLATLFSKSTWQGVGGVVAMGFETTSVLQKFGWGKFLYIWGALSVNLAIINLLPFPGLDGWQLLVLIVEGISKKKIPDKVKRIVSLVGLGLLFTLMIVLVIKDVFTYIL